MDNLTTAKLVELTNIFYTSCAQSFSQTRERAWDGWDQALKEIKNINAEGAASESKITNLPISVLDLACGNMRFSRFLEQNKITSQVLGIDSCNDLHALGEAASFTHVHTNYVQLDIISALANNSLTQTLLTNVTSKLDLSVCFGFFHHLPQYELRKHALQSLIDLTKQDGFIVIAFWQFTNSERLLKKATDATKRAQLTTEISLDTANGDYFLGWQDDTNIFRYCHNYSEEEINSLITTQDKRVREVARFSADGKTNNLNRYVILQVV
jgi:SAM-dependent methyltransferase